MINKSILQRLINDAFHDQKPINSETLLEADFKEWAHCPLNENILRRLKNGWKFISSEKFYEKLNFIEENMIDGTSHEPFRTWQEIPAWYIERYSLSGLLEIPLDRLYYYLPQFMTLFINENFETIKHCKYAASLDNWFDLLLPPETLIKDITYWPFDGLSAKQKKATALFLAYDLDMGFVDLDYDLDTGFMNAAENTNEENNASYRFYWLPSL